MTKRIAVVTGGASGIGLCTAEKLLAQGWTVWSLDIAHPKRRSTHDRHRTLDCDVSNGISVAAAFAKIKDTTSTLHALVSSAGVIRPASVLEQSEEDVDLMLRVNFKGAWLVMREALPLLRAAGNPESSARVVMIGSGAGIRPKVGTGIYAATKAALHTMAAVLAVELGPSGILVNAVAPGSVNTPMLSGAASSASPSSQYRATGVSPLGRVAEPDDIVDVVLFLLSDASRYVNGTVIGVDGGSRAAIAAAPSK